MVKWLALAVLCGVCAGTGPATKPAAQAERDEFRAFADRLRGTLQTLSLPSTQPITPEKREGRTWPLPGTVTSTESHTVELLSVDIVQTNSLLYPKQAIARFRSSLFRKSDKVSSFHRNRYWTAFARDESGKWILVRGTMVKEEFRVISPHLLLEESTRERPVSGIEEELPDDWMQEYIRSVQVVH